MGLQENLISVVETILCAETLEEALVTYTANITLLKDCKFFLFEGKSFPVPPVVNAEYANGMGCGYGIYALSHTDELLVLDKKRVMEMYDGNAKVKATVCVDFDTQILTELKKYYEDKSKCPEAFCNLLADLEMYKCDYTCLPYIFENGSKLNDARIRKGMCECLKVYFHYKENSLHDFGLGLPFSNETYLNTKRIHAMLTHDFGLQDVLKSVPLQRLAIVQNTNGLLPTTIPKYKLQLSDIIVDNIDIERNFVENKTIRKQTQNQVDFDKLIGKLEDELSMYMK